MASADPYSVGTVTVANGGTTVTGTGTFWIGKVRKNDMFFVPAQGLQARVTADPTSNTSLSITPWAGDALSGDAYETFPIGDSTSNTARLRDLLADMTVVKANGRGLFYRFSDTVTDADPGAGYIRLGNVDPALATAAYIDLLDANGATVAAIIDTWDNAGSADGRGQLWLRSIATPSTFRAYDVVGSVVDGTGYRSITIEHVGGSGTFADDEELMVTMLAVGIGETGQSAYEAAVEAGFIGTEAEWIASLGGIFWKTDWNSGTTYGLNDGVLDNGSSWRSLQNGNLNHAPPNLPTTSNAWWKLISAKGTDGTGTGDVVGPAGGVTDGQMAAADGTTGKLIKFLAPAAARTAIGAREKGIGEFFWFMGNTAPSYGLVLSGQTGLLRADYPALWAHIQTSGLLAASDGARSVAQFGPGNGTTTFSLPNFTGDKRFIRANTGANIGTVQADATDVNGLSATTTATSNAATLQPNDGGGFDMARGPGTASVSLTSSDAETRPLNISLLPCVVAL